MKNEVVFDGSMTMEDHRNFHASMIQVLEESPEDFAKALLLRMTTNHDNPGIVTSTLMSLLILGGMISDEIKLRVINQLGATIQDAIATAVAKQGNTDQPCPKLS